MCVSDNLARCQATISRLSTYLVVTHFFCPSAASAGCLLALQQTQCPPVPKHHVHKFVSPGSYQSGSSSYASKCPSPPQLSHSTHNSLEPQMLQNRCSSSCMSSFILPFLSLLLWRTCLLLPGSCSLH